MPHATIRIHCNSDGVITGIETVDNNIPPKIRRNLADQLSEEHEFLLEFIDAIEESEGFVTYGN